MPGMQDLTGLYFTPSLNYISFNKHFHTFEYFLFINAMTCHYDLTLDTNLQSDLNLEASQVKAKLVIQC